MKASVNPTLLLIGGAPQTFYASNFLHTSSLVLSKLSLLVLLHSVFAVPGFRLTCWILGVVVVLYWVPAIFGGAFICFPPSSLWDFGTQATCGNDTLLNFITPIPWVLTDFAILISPIPMIKHLHVTKRKRVSLYAMFLFGGV